jgi:diguanylate cyclase (GGDEF)-like protein
MKATSRPIVLADLLHRAATRGQIVAACLFFVAAAAIAVAAAPFGSVQGPFLRPFIPICATLWGSADLLTAFLLWTQFSVNGIRAFAVFGSAYAISGLLTVAYVGYFPKLFTEAPVGPGYAQVSVWLWVGWHVAFAVIIGGYHLIDRSLEVRIPESRSISRVLWLVGSGCAFFVAAVIAVVVGFRLSLPVIVVGGGFSTLYATVIAPLIVLTNGAAIAFILYLARRPSALQIWILVALATAALDGALNAFASGRYTVSWYVGKIETLSTATVVLAMLLAEVNVLYRRLGELATVDGLTGIANRQSFNGDVRWVLHLRERTKFDAVLLVVDIDHFKKYNDRYGHLAGDATLRLVAHAIRRTCARSADIVARYGGEEFVAFLPSVSEKGGFAIAESIRAAVEALAIEHAASPTADVVTVSVGAAYAGAGDTLEFEPLFALADGALYAAKVSRNMVCFAASSTRAGSVPDAAPIGPLAP